MTALKSGAMPPFPRRPSPSQADRQRVQEELTRLVGLSRLHVEDFDHLVQEVWACETQDELSRIQQRGREGSGAQIARPGGPAGQLIPMAQAQPPHLPSHPSGTPENPVRNNWGEIRRSGVWTIPADSYFHLRGASLHLDLREAHAVAPTVFFHIKGDASEVHIIVPPGVHVENRADRKMFSSESISVTEAAPGAPTVVIMGVLRGTSLTVVTEQVAPSAPGWKRWLGRR